MPTQGFPMHRFPSCLAAWILALLMVPMVASSAVGQSNEAKNGYIINVPVPMLTEESEKLLTQLTRLAETAPEGERLTVVLRYPENVQSGDATSFEDALRIARAFTQPELRRIRIVSWVEGEVTGHSTLPVIASDTLLMGRRGIIADATAGETTADETISLTYKSIAAKRQLFKQAIVHALVDPGAELVFVSKVGGGQEYATGDELKTVSYTHLTLPTNREV